MVTTQALKSVVFVLSLLVFIETSAAQPVENLATEQGIAVLIHGFGDSPESMKPLGEYLSSQGIRVEYVLLPGHGSNLEDFRKTSWEDWVQGGLHQVENFGETSDPVYLIGFSIGANIAALISEDLEVSKLVLVSPAIEFREPWYFPFKTSSIIRGLKGIVPYLPKLSRGDIVDDSGINLRGQHYRWHPLDALFELTLLMSETVAIANRIDTPCLVVHGEMDRTMDFRATERFYADISSNQKELLLLEESGHYVLLDQESDRLYAQISEFLLETQ